MEGSFINFLRTTDDSIHDSSLLQRQSKIGTEFDSNDVKLLIYPFVNKVNIMFDPVRDVAGQRDERRTDEKGKVIKRLQFQRLCFYSFFLMQRCHSGYLAKQRVYNRIMANS